MTRQSTVPWLGTSLLDEWNLVEQRLRQDFARQIHNFHIKMLDDGLVLEGHTKTYYGKQAVQHAVMDVTDVPIVANNIIVG